MRYPPDNDNTQRPDDNAAPTNQGKRARTIRDMFDKPLKRLTSAPHRGRPANRHPDDPPHDYDLREQGAPGPNSRRRWTEPGAYLHSDQTPPNNPRQFHPEEQPDNRRGYQPMEPPAAPQGGHRAAYNAEPHAPPMADETDTRGIHADARWQRPDWLNQTPPADPASDDSAPPPAARHPIVQDEVPRYQLLEEDPKQQTDYRSTSARAALWASRTPAYQPDQPAQVAPREIDLEERGYFEAYATRRTPASLAHADASMVQGQAGAYAPGAVSEVDRLRNEAKASGRTNGPAPYFWEMVKKPRQTSPLMIGVFWLVSLLVFASALLSASYAGISVYTAVQLSGASQAAIKGTPASAGLAYKDVMFTSRTDNVLLRGWFIPGVTSPGHLSVAKTIIMAHGPNANREDTSVGQLALSEALAKQGYAVLTFDLRGSGDSASAPSSMGYFEARDILGAVDFLRTGEIPYSKLGRPKAIGAWGVSTGAVALLLAAAQEPGLRAIVADSAFADAMPILQRDIPRQSHLSHYFTPGIIEAEQIMYGMDYSALKPVSVVASIAPRPIFFIHGAADTYVPPSDMAALAQAAQKGSNAHVTTWSVAGAQDGQAYHTAGQEYVTRVVAFFAANLSPAP